MQQENTLTYLAPILVAIKQQHFHHHDHHDHRRRSHRHHHHHHHHLHHHLHHHHIIISLCSLFVCLFLFICFVCLFASFILFVLLPHKLIKIKQRPSETETASLSFTDCPHFMSRLSNNFQLMFQDLTILIKPLLNNDVDTAFQRFISFPSMGFILVFFFPSSS